MIGERQIDALLIRMMRALGPDEWLVARVASARTMLAVETCARSLARLVQNGAAEANTKRPRGYRWLPFAIELPAGFLLERAHGQEPRIVSGLYYPDGGAVSVWLRDGMITDEGNALFRLEDFGQTDHGVRIKLEAFARSRSVVFDGKALLIAPADARAVELVAQTSRDAVRELRR